MLLLLLMFAGAACLRMLQVYVPSHVVEHGTATLECNFDLEDETLYAVKWYKDGNEFYHYQPGDDPPALAFPEFGLDVDMGNSSMSHVTLRAVPLSASGRYHCEVSGEAPAFQMVTDHGHMTVLSIPSIGPHMYGKKARYQIGEWLELNCSSPGAHPVPQLSWFVNGERVDSSSLLGPLYEDQSPLVATVLGLRFKIRPKHFRNGDMKLKCLMTVDSVYSRSNEASALLERPHKSETSAALESRKPGAALDRNESRALFSHGISDSWRTSSLCLLVCAQPLLLLGW